jgi:hypothetical protein
VRLLALLGQLADHSNAGGPQQLAQLGEVLGGRLGGDADRALARATLTRGVLAGAAARPWVLCHCRSIIAHGRREPSAGARLAV